MKQSEDLKNQFTAEARRRGEESRDQVIGPSGHGLSRPVSGHDFSQAVERKNNWASTPAVFRRTIHMVRAILREIFDESAYERFLLKTEAVRSVESYRVFLVEREAMETKKPRCC